MPEYFFENLKTKEIHSEIFHMNESKDYRGPKGKDKKGIWRRVWTKPQMGVDTVKIDPHSSKDFVKATNKTNGNIGDLWDRSEELSKKRADKEGGRDPIKEKFYENYEKKRKGRKHPDVQRREVVNNLAKKGIRITGLED